MSAGPVGALNDCDVCGGELATPGAACWACGHFAADDLVTLDEWCGADQEPELVDGLEDGEGEGGEGEGGDDRLWTRWESAVAVGFTVGNPTVRHVRPCAVCDERNPLVFPKDWPTVWDPFWYPPLDGEATPAWVSAQLRGVA